MKWMKPTFFSVCINEVSNHLSKTIHLFQMHTIEEYSEILEHALSDFQYPGVAPRLYTPVKYTLEGGGKRLRPMLLMLSNGIVALSSALYTQYQGFADVNAGRGAIVIGLAAVIIGEVIFGKIFRNFALKLTAAVIGAIIYYIVMNFVLRMGLSTDDLKLLTALVVAVFLTIPYWKGKYFTKTPVKKGGKDNA